MNPVFTVVLPVIRRIMPSVISQEILDIQPMTGGFSIFGARPRWSDTEHWVRIRTTVKP